MALITVTTCSGHRTEPAVTVRISATWRSDPQVHQGRNSLTRAIAIPGAPTQVNEMSVQAAIMSPESYAYGARLTPTYLR